jgi:hypothetical protein
MKTAVKIVIFIFFIFLSTPTIVSLIEKNMDISIFYSTAEFEEINKDVKSEFKFDTFSIVFFSQPRISSLILSKNLSKHDNIATSIFIPPPDSV